MFDNLKKYKTKHNLILNIYIQGNEIPSNLNYDNPNIILNIKNLSYKEISNLYKNNDIFIHMGCHEGLGLGLYESISVGTPVITIDNCPNNEIIVEPINGWNVNYKCERLTDNDQGITRKSVFDENDLLKKIIYIDKTYNRKNIFNSVIKYNDINSKYIDILINHI